MSHVTGPTDIIITLAPFLSLSAPQSLYKVYPYTLLILFHQAIPPLLLLCNPFYLYAHCRLSY